MAALLWVVPHAHVYVVVAEFVLHSLDDFVAVATVVFACFGRVVVY